MRTRALVAAVAAVLLLVGCTEAVPNPGDGKADGQYAEYTPAQRTDPVEFDTTTADGTEVSTKALAGKVVVINFWYAACAPCRVEAPVLEQVVEDNPDVTFIGVNVRDGAAEAAAFQKKYDVSYPTVLDKNNGAMLLAFAKTRPANATPTTMVLDRDGRVAATVSGQLQAADILDSMLDTVLAEGS